MATAIIRKILAQADNQQRLALRDEVMGKRPKPPVRSYIQLNDGTQLVFDAATDIQHNFKAKVTEYPVEKGTNVSDHVVYQNPAFSITGIFSDANATINRATGRVSQTDVYTRILDQIKKRTFVTLKTTLATYQNLIITDVSAPRSLNVGKALELTVSFQEIRLVETSTTVVQASSAPKSSADNNNTSGNTKDATTDETNKGNVAGKPTTDIGVNILRQLTKGSP